MILDPLDKTFELATAKTRPRCRWRRRVCRQITAQVLHMAAVTALVLSLLLATPGRP